MPLQPAPFSIHNTQIMTEPMPFPPTMVPSFRIESITFTRLRGLSTLKKSCGFNPNYAIEVHIKHSWWLRCSFLEEQQHCQSCTTGNFSWWLLPAEEWQWEDLYRQSLWWFFSRKQKHLDRIIVLFAKLKAKATKDSWTGWLLHVKYRLSMCRVAIV